MPPWGPDLENKSILFYSVTHVCHSEIKQLLTLFFAML